MKILMALTYYYPHWTGLTAYARRLAERLAARGHRITVVTSRFRRDLAPEEEHNGVHIVRLSSWLRLSRGQVMLGFIPVVNRLVREHDLVQIHTPMLEAWVVGILAHMAGRKMVMTHHGDLVMPAGLWNLVVQKLVGCFLERGARLADVITIHSQDYAENSDYLRPRAEKVVAIHPPVDIPTPDMAAVAAWRRELGLDGAKLVGFAGRFVEEKGFDYLLKAVPHVLERMPNVKFAYAGDHNVVYEDFFGRWRHLWHANNEHMVMLGLITDQQKLANFYAMCDVFALPSRTDCFPSVQIEAMLCGTPVVAGNIPGARQVVERSKMGLLVEPRNEVALAGGLLEVLSHPGDYIRPRDEMHSLYDPEKSVSEYERLFQSMVQGTPYLPSREEI